MPPKKKDKKQEPLVEYDVSLMNTEELKAYARMLEQEIEAFRDFNGFYLQAEDKMAGVLRTRQEHVQQMSEEIVKKDVEVEELKSEIQRKLDEREEEKIYHDFVSDKRKKFQKVNSKLTEDLHFNQYHQEIEKRLHDNDIKFEAEKKEMQMARKEEMEKNTEKIRNTKDYEESLWNNAIEKLDDNLTETVTFYELALDTIKAEALEAKRRGENSFDKTCQSYKQRLKDYFKQNIRKDLDVLKNLEMKAMKLRSSIESTKLQMTQLNTEHLKSAEIENSSSSFELVQPQTEYKKMDVPVAHKNRKIEKIRNENKILEKKIKVTEDETDKLRDKFTQTLYKIRQSAEKEAKLLEEKLNSSLN
ncbi:hypothetical protein JTE90_008871 [Oedothorax gibbosus]|uniref:Uncharacterized protein n=1 Tax=Oedothorax gibbosus TaxID=931172 RepID=A0AAV6TP97_9ARAC|nr:hypothetical protein JTE90_008871 [Oedothorax gibbosus]